MGLETPSEYGGAECSFTAAILAVEELAKIDPSISALCDIHVSFYFYFLHCPFLLVFNLTNLLFYIEHFNQYCDP